MPIKRLGKRRGMALATVLALLGILFVIGAAISITAVSHASFTLGVKNEAAAQSAARSGLSLAIGAAKTISDWTTLGSSGSFTALEPPNKLYPDPGNTHVYFQVSVEPFSPAPTSNTALVRSTGYVYSGTNGTGQLLKQRQLNAFIHQQFPWSLRSAIYSATTINITGNAYTISCSPGYVVSMNGGLGSLNGCPPSQVVNSPNPSLWPFPELAVSTAITAAQSNNVNNMSPVPAGVVGHYFPSSSIPSGYDPWSSFSIIAACTRTDSTPQSQPMIGINFFDAAPLTTVTIGGNGGNLTSDPLTCTSPQSGPDILIVRNGNVEIGGNRSYNGVIVAPEGQVWLHGTPTVNGAIFARSVLINGNVTVNYNQNYVTAARNNFLFRTVVIVDSTWIGTESPVTP